MLEARASRDGLILARQQGEQKVILETDCLELVNLWKKDSQRSIIDPILKEIESIVLAFQEFAFVFVKHCCNKIAHVLHYRIHELCRVPPKTLGKPYYGKR